ncbi:hypothetical protein [Streptomyces sp. NBC_01637]|uniref:hypothetical protein n=1 Tax=unclassified Streptomyces TaxID=2593676 RepID=UPI00386903B4|nr:hypothetical protein OH719_08605 [Streptomyces sp. NBC_01653]WTD92942.1 hypothetical protein OG891_38265 [Streptomyces sp. NBC_01637]
MLLLLKAFSSGCSALTGVEAIPNGVPAFREPRVKRAQRTELMLGALLGLMLIGLAVLIRRDHVAPRGGVTVLAQLTAGSYGTGWPYYTTNLIVTLALAFAANTSFRRPARPDESARQGPPAASSLRSAQRAPRLPLGSGGPRSARGAAPDRRTRTRTG